MSRVADRFEAGGGMAAGARFMLESAIMEAEPQPFPVSQRMLDGWCARDWDWETFEYV